jgi:hypothetical protein
VDVIALAMQASLFVFMVASLGGVGLGVAPRDVLAPLTNGRFVLLLLASGWLVGPAVALLLLRVIPIDGPYATALLLLALAPGAPFAPAMMRLAGGDSAYVAAFMAVTAGGNRHPPAARRPTADSGSEREPVGYRAAAHPPRRGADGGRERHPRTVARHRRARRTDRGAHCTRRHHGHAGAGHGRLRPRRLECRRQPRDSGPADLRGPR